MSKRTRDGELKLDVVYRRDNGICHLCREYVPRSSASLDHLVRKAEGGTLALTNLKLAHVGCNNRRHNKPPEEFFRYVTKVRRWYSYLRTHGASLEQSVEEHLHE